MTMSFWDIFFPVFSALFGGFVLKEAFQFSMFKLYQRKQQKMQQEVEERIGQMLADGRLPSPEEMGGYFPMPMGMPTFPNYPAPTASGESETVRGTYDGRGTYI